MPIAGKDKLEKFQKGDLNFRDMVGFDAKQEAALLLTAHSLLTNGRLEDARKIFEGLAVLDATNPYVHGILGSIYQKQGKHLMAVAHYTLALNLFPEDKHSLLNRGEIFLKLGKFVEAAADLKKIIALDPDQKNPAANRARLLVGLTQDALALTKQKGLNAVIAEKARIQLAHS
jgi:Flp pilus assembly protein TadD